MNRSVIRRLEVPGAQLHYEVRGAGPVLLLIPGGPADGAVFDNLADVLGRRYTVATYDPRGLSRSTLDGPAGDLSVEGQADDAHHLLAAVGASPAYVFGNSGGAVTGLALVTRHPGQVATLVAHEPPITELLPDIAQLRATQAEVYDTYLREGAAPALEKFLSLAGFESGPGPGHAPPSPEMLAALARMRQNLDLFFSRMFRPIIAYRPDPVALRSGSTRIVVAQGTTSQGQLAQRTAVSTASFIGAPLVTLPGGHADFTSQPEAFADALDRVLRG
jgi:pimeloyl-ACP methyl ester carboxylesterase